MKKFFSFMLISLILGLFGVNVLAFDLEAKFIDSEYGYSIKYPLDWNARINRSGMVLANIDSKDNKAGLQIRITQSRKPMDVYIENYIDQFKRDMQAQLLYQEDMIIDSKKAYKLSFKANRGGKDYLLLNYIIPDEQTEKIFIFQSGVLYPQRYEIMPILEAIAGSFELN